MQKVYFVTGNEGKFKEVQAFLGDVVERVEADTTEVQSISVSEIAALKAKEAYAQLHKPVLVEDTGLAITAWNGLPGPLIKWFLKTVHTDGLCRMLSEFQDRSAVATTVFGYFDGEELMTFVGEVAGSIADAPRGDNGFGWDTVFIPKGGDKTFAQMTMEEKTAVSMRGRALEKLKVWLEERS